MSRLAVPPQDVVSLFRREVPDALSEAIVKAIRDASRAAATESRARFAPDQAKESQPWERRAYLGTALLALQGRFPGLIVTSEHSGGNSYHVRIDSGGFTLLVARAAEPDAVLRKAAYRKEIALASLQESLFEVEQPAPDARLYGVILYGGPNVEVDPRFIVLRFPTRDHGAYLDDRLDLKMECAHLFTEVTPVEEIADDTVRLTLKTTRRAQTGEGA